MDSDVRSIGLVNNLITKNSAPLNEGYSTLLGGNLVSLITEKLNYNDEDNPYYFRIHKTANYAIMRIPNGQTVVVIKLKLKASVSGEDKDDLVQLFAEAHLVCEQEQKVYEQLLCIYGNY